jgi:hypothetical protein
MPPVRFGARGVFVDAIAMAVREAWAVADARQRVPALEAALRRILGREQAEALFLTALKLYHLQPAAPADDRELVLCLRCRQVKTRGERQPPRGRWRLAILRDPLWMSRQFENLRRSDRDVATELRCTVGSVAYWREYHKIDAPRTHQPYMSAAWLREQLVDRRLGPGEVAGVAGCTPARIREWARTLGVVKNGRDYAYFTREWWTDRLARGFGHNALGRAAGIVDHSVPYHLRKWGLFEERPEAVRSRLAAPVYPQLYEPGWLARELRLTPRPRPHDRGFVAIAKKLGCSPTAVKRAAGVLGLLPRTRGRPATPWASDPDWYRDRFQHGRTVEDLAREAGIKVKSIWNYLAELQLLEEYHTRVERIQRPGLPRFGPRPRSVAV